MAKKKLRELFWHLKSGVISSEARDPVGFSIEVFGHYIHWISHSVRDDPLLVFMKIDSDPKKTKAFSIPRDFYMSLVLLSSAGLQWVLTVYLFSKLGAYLDKQYGGRSYGLICFLLGASLGLFLFLKIALLKKNTDKEE